MKYEEQRLQDILSGMRAVSRVFYAQASQINYHQFIEFCGFMNEFIKLCESARDQGIDFTQTEALPIRQFEAAYLGEKFECIFGATMRKNPEAWRRFVASVEEHSATKQQDLVTEQLDLGLPNDS